MEAAGFGNPLLYFNMRENYYTHVINRSHAFGNAHILVFLELIGTISVYSANAEWNSSAERLWNRTEWNRTERNGTEQLFQV